MVVFYFNYGLFYGESYISEVMKKDRIPSRGAVFH